MERPHQEHLPDVLREYELWSQLTRVGGWEMVRMRNEAPYLGYRPKISILLAVHDPERAGLERALDSVMSQTYPYWELYVCQDGPTEAHIGEILGLYERLDERIRVKRLDKNTGIARATNEAFSLATGEFVGLLEHDVILAPHALFEIVRFMQNHPDADLLYTDEDEIDEAGNPLHPHFKPGWSPDLAMSFNYVNHFSVYRRSVLQEIGGWREGFDGAHNLDLMLRYTEKTDKVHRLSKVLCHRRTSEGSVVADPDSEHHTHERARRAVRDALERRSVRGEVLDGDVPGSFRVEREIEGRPMVSVLIPLREDTDYARCAASLERQTTYPNYEVILIRTEKGSPEGEALSERTKVVPVAGEPTPLELYNSAIGQAEGEYVLLLDPGLEALSEGWLETLLQHAQRVEVGAVGGKQVSPEGHTLQAGLILDPEGPLLTPEEQAELPLVFYRPYNREDPGFRVPPDLTRNCSAVSGACMMFHKETFEATGGFDTTHLKDSFGDVDLCMRLREKDYLVVYTPYARFARHDSGPATGLEPEQVGYVRERWGEVLENDPYYNPNLLWSANWRSVLKLIGLGSNKSRAATGRPQSMEH